MMSATPAWLPKEYSTGYYYIEMVTHRDINPVQQGLTSVNKREPVFFPLMIAVPELICQNSFYAVKYISTYFKISWDQTNERCIAFLGIHFIKLVRKD